MRYKHLKTHLLLIGLLAGYAFSSEAYAACTASQGFMTQDISMAVGRVVVKPSDPVGKILRKSTFPIASNGSSITCDGTGSATIEAILLQNFQLSPLGNSIYNTNIEGIGIRLYREAVDATNFSGFYPYTRTVAGSTTYTLSPGFFVVEIIKTAPNTGSGALAPGPYSSYRFTNNRTRPWLTSAVYGDTITIASSSCEIQGNINKTVQLPTVNKTNFQGIGSTIGEQAFDLSILCNGGTSPAGFEETSNISLNFDYTAAANTVNVIENSAPIAERATGVAVQLVSNYNNVNKVIAKNEKIALGSLTSNQSIQHNIPLAARYYQTGPVVTPGSVRSVATVTIQYQ